MKKRILQLSFIIALSFFTNQIQAQWNIGGGLSIGSTVESLGIHLRGQRNFVDKIDGAAGLNFFFGRFGRSQFALNADAHYHLSKQEKIDIYGIGGLNISRVSYNNHSVFGGSNIELGLNIGAGARMSFSEKLMGFGEIKYVLSGFDQLVLTAGVLFPMGS